MEHEIPNHRLKKAGRTCRHLMISPPSGVIKEDMKMSKIFDICSKHLNKEFPDVIGGEIVFHPFRLKDEIKIQLRDYCQKQKISEPSYSSGGFWKLARDDVLNLGCFDDYRVFSPHWHILCFGYFPNATEYHQKTNGWVYKNIRNVSLNIQVRDDGSHENDVESVISYLLTHCGIELNDAGKAVKSRRSFGLMTPRYFRLADGFSQIVESYRLCPECSTKLIVVDENGIPKLHTRYGSLAEDYYDDFVYCSVVTKIPNYDLHNPVKRVKKSSPVVPAPELSMVDNRFTCEASL